MSQSGDASCSIKTSQILKVQSSSGSHEGGEIGVRMHRWGVYGRQSGQENLRTKASMEGFLAGCLKSGISLLLSGETVEMG